MKMRAGFRFMREFGPVELSLDSCVFFFFLLLLCFVFSAQRCERINRIRE